MKRIAVPLFIVAYLGVLVLGLLSHALKYNTYKHPAMYFIVWDMFCGWSAYETRIHVIGEGASGNYYQLTPGPWGAVKPFGNHDRRTHDYNGTYVVNMAQNTLRQTSHEPMVRVLVVDEAWPRKFNLPDNLWVRRYSEPKDPMSYFQVRRITTPDGEVIQNQPAWLSRVAMDCLMDNPRLRRDMSEGRQYYAIHPDHARGRVTPASFELPVE
jgi:hypothetical protein